VVHRLVAEHVHRADAELRALDDVDRDGDALVGDVDHRLADVHADVALVHVQPLDLVEVLVEQRLRIQPRVVPELRHPRGDVPGLGLHHLAQLVVGERLVAVELDVAELELLALGDVEVHPDRAFTLGLERVLHLRLVVALGLVLGFDPRLVLEQERVVDGGADGDGELLLDVVGGDRVVSGDADLADDRVLAHHVGHHGAAVRGAVDLHAHVVEEAEPVDALHVLRDARGAELVADLGADHRLHRVGLDAAVASDPDVGDHRAEAAGIGRGGHRRRRAARGEIDRRGRRSLLRARRARERQREQRGQSYTTASRPAARRSGIWAEFEHRSGAPA